MSQRVLKSAGIHLYGASAAFALKMVMMVPRVTADKPHDLISAQKAFGPPFSHESFKVPVNRG
jgi:hypothetical protein